MCGVPSGTPRPGDTPANRGTKAFAPVTSIVPTVAPVFGLILLGHVFRRFNFPSPDFWPASERLTYYVLIPALFISGFSGREFDASYVDLSLTILLSISAISILLAALQFVLKLEGPTFTSVFQGAIRPNIYIGFPLASVLLGEDWLTLTAVASLTMIPLVNVFSVLALSMYGANGWTGLGTALLQVLKTPPIIACAIGMAISFLHVDLPDSVDNFLEITSNAAFLLGLLTVGAGLHFRGLRRQIVPVTVAAAVHLFVLPVMTYFIAGQLGLGGAAYDTALLFTAVPVAASAYILSRQLGGDDKAMALIITTQVVLSGVTLPLMLEVLGR